MANEASNNDVLKDKVRKMAAEGKTISRISQELGISWNEVRSYTASWQGTKVKLTNRLKRLATESDQGKRRRLADEADQFADFLYDAAKHLRSQVDGARRALDW